MLDDLPSQKYKKIIGHENLQDNSTPVEVLPDNYLETQNEHETVLFDTDAKKEKYSIDQINLSHLQKNCEIALKKIIKKYEPIFSADSSDIGRTSLLTYNIELESLPISQKQRIIHDKHLKLAEPTVREYLQQGIIRRCNDASYISNLILT